MASHTLQSTVEISGVLSPSLQAAIKNAVGRLDEMSEGTLASAGAAEKLCAEISTQESLLSSLQKGYADYVVSGQEGSEEAQALAGTIVKLSGELEENRGALHAAETATKRLTETQDDSADAYTRLERTINDQEDELEKLRREYANVVLEQGKTSKEAKQLESKISSLSGELSDNKKKLKDVGDAAEKAGEKAENSSEGYTILKNVIANLATEAIQKAVEAFKELATEGDTALGMLEARTGATTSEMDGLEDVMYEIYNSNYGDSLGGVSEALSTVIQMTDDLDNASLSQITKNAITLEDVFGFDVPESMRAVNSLMDQFGLTSDQAFDLIAEGAQNGLNQNGDLLDIINEYSVQFKNAGYTADDMFNMLVNGASTGTWSVDKLGDAVKEFNIRASDGTISKAIEENAAAFNMTKAEAEALGDEVESGNVEAYQKLLDKLKEVDDDAQRYQLGVAMFGTMWEDLGEEAVFALMSTEGELGKASDAMEKMDSAAHDTLEGSLSQLGRTIKSEVVQPIAEKLTPAIKKAVDYVNKNVGPAVDWILSHLPEIGIVLGTLGSIIAAMKWGAIVAKVTKVIGVIKGFIGLLAGISAPVWAVIAVVAVLAAAFTNLWRNNEEFRNKMTAIWEGIKGKFAEFGQTITDKLNELGFNFENFGEVVGAIWDGFCSLLAPVFEGAFQYISDTLSFCLNMLISWFDIFAGIFTGDWERVWEGVKSIFANVWEYAVSIFSNWGTTLQGLADVVLGWFGTNWEAVWNAIKAFFVNTWNGIVSFFSNTWNSIKTGVSNAWNAVKSVTSSVWNSIKSAIFSVWSGIQSGVSSAVNSVRSAVSGVWNGIKSTTVSVWNAIKSAITTPINKAWSVVSGVINKLKNAFNFSWSLPDLKLPHISVSGGKAPYGIGGKGKLPSFSIEWYKDGGIMTNPTVFGVNPATGSLMAGGEAGAEAILPLSVLWEKLEAILRRILSGTSSTGGNSDEGLTSKAGELLALDNFSLGSLSDGTSVVIYYDFSGFTWSPQIQKSGTGDDEDDLMARLRAHEAEFFDWLEEFIHMREVAQYGA